MTAALDLEEEVTFDNDKNVENLPRSEKLLKKSLLIDCMINMSGKGSRLAVMKVTDAENEKNIGRLQVRKEDEVSSSKIKRKPGCMYQFSLYILLYHDISFSFYFQETMKLELFMHGEQMGSLNYFQNEAGMTNVTMEEFFPNAEKCGYDNEEYEQSFNETSSFNDTTSFNQSSNNETNNDVENRCKFVSRFLESFTGDGVYESRIYKDIFLMFDPPGYRKEATKGEKSLVFEEKIMMKDDVYDAMVLFGGYERNAMHCKLNNTGDNTHIEMEMKNTYLDWQSGEYRPSGGDEKITLDITPSTDKEDDFNMKLSYKDDRIFDGWFYLTTLIQRYARQEVPAIIQRTLENFQETHAETTNQISEFLIF